MTLVILMTVVIFIRSVMPQSPAKPTAQAVAGNRGAGEVEKSTSVPGGKKG